MLSTLTEYVPGVVTTIEDVVCPPGDQMLPTRLLDVMVTLFPGQKTSGPFSEIVGVNGVGFTVTVVAAEVAEQPKPLVTVTS